METERRLRADFNGLFQEAGILSLSHQDACPDQDGNLVELREGMAVTAYDQDEDDDGKRDDLIASGVVERSPEWLRCTGSRWILRIDENGVRHESDLRQLDPPPTEL